MNEHIYIYIHICLYTYTCMHIIYILFFGDADLRNWRRLCSATDCFLLDRVAGLCAPRSKWIIFMCLTLGGLVVGAPLELRFSSVIWWGFPVVKHYESLSRRWIFVPNCWFILRWCHRLESEERIQRRCGRSLKFEKSVGVVQPYLVKH